MLPAQRYSPSEQMGIALERFSKRVVEGMLYILERVFYPPEASIVIITKADQLLNIRDYANVRLGSDGGLALLSIEDPASPENLLVKGESDHWVLTLISPALLEGDPLNENNWPLLTSRKSSEGLAQALLSKYKCIDYAEIRLIPKGEYPLEIISPGWSTARGSLREPNLLVPPGTTLYLEANTNCVKRIVKEGTGDHAEMGWGSVVVAPVMSTLSGSVAGGRDKNKATVSSSYLREFLGGGHRE